MSANEWTIIGVFVATQIILFVGVVVALKGDNKLMQAQMTDVREELKQLTKVMITQAEHKATLNNMAEQMTLTGKRVDEQGRRLNKFVDAIALSANARALLTPDQSEDD